MACGPHGIRRKFRVANPQSKDDIQCYPLPVSHHRMLIDMASLYCLAGVVSYLRIVDLC